MNFSSDWLEEKRCCPTVENVFQQFQIVCDNVPQQVNRSIITTHATGVQF